MSPLNLLAHPSRKWLRFDGSNSKAMSDPASALVKDFTTAAPFGTDETRLTLQSYGGTISGVIQWLRFEFENGRTYENSPFDGVWSHWGQPIYKAAAPFDTAPGDPVEVVVRRRDAEF